MRKPNHDVWTDRLSEYLDGSLPLLERVQLRRHLEECRSCTAVLAELHAVIARASDLEEERPPEHDLWHGVVASIEGRAAPSVLTGKSAGPGRGWRESFAQPRLIAASVVLLVVTAAGTWLALSDVPVSIIDDGAQTTPTPSQASIDAGNERTDAVVAELERSLAENRTLLDPTTVGVIETNLAILDQALDEARRALAEDPTSTYLNMHVSDTMRRKLQLLLDANNLFAQ